MTAKRFYKQKSSIRDYMLYDEDREDAYFISCDEHTIDTLVNLLNELHKENNMLKSSNIEYEDIFGRLEEENEKLKKHIEEHSIDERLLDDLYLNQVGGI